MDPMPGMTSRRDFLQAGVASAAGLAVCASAEPSVPQSAWSSPPICVFSKHLQFLDPRALARTCREIGADGVDLTVRTGGHVLPERVAEDLPCAAEAIRSEGLVLGMITTSLKSATDPHAEAIARTAAAEGIRYLRIGGHRYEGETHPEAQLLQVTADLRGLAELFEHHGVVGGYHNHSGRGHFGAPLWDLYQVCKAVGSPSLGSNFDVGHAKVEGAYGAWETNAALLAPWVKMMSFKDFVWEEGRPRWVPLGEGLTPLPEFMRVFLQSGFNGPISIHVEYDVGSDAGMVQALREAVPVAREALG